MYPISNSVDRMGQIYLDFNATTPLADSVIEIIYSQMKTSWANPSSTYEIGRMAKNMVEMARERIAQMLQTKPSNIIFTSGGTEGNNMAIFSAVKHCRKQFKFKPHVITSSVEHDATFKALEHLNLENEIDISYVKPSSSGEISVSEIMSLLNERTCLITIMMANNETGVIFPISEIGKYLESVNETRIASGFPKVLFHTDAAQAVGKIQLNAECTEADYISIAGHKFYGPKIGCLYLRKGAPIYPLLFGGGQENGLRPGTENTPLIAGLGEAAKLVSQNISVYSEHMCNMRNLLEEELRKKFSPDDLVFNFTSAKRLPNTLSVSFPNRNGKALLQESQNIVASTGSACHSSSAQISRVVSESLNKNLWHGTLRLSVGRETTDTDIKEAVNDLASAFNKTKPLDLAN